jgi:voltage-gated potassium channel
MEQLPENLRLDVAQFLFATFVDSDFFPKEEKGALLMIMHLCKIKMVCKGEFIMEQGEIGLEMYFIIDGHVEVISPAGDVFATMYAGTPFGEMALLNPTPSVRSAHIRAAEDVSLAVLSLNDFKFIMSKYPDFARKVRR